MNFSKYKLNSEDTNVQQATDTFATHYNPAMH